MDKPQIDPSHPPDDSQTRQREAMLAYGITRVPVDYFHYKEFRYTNLHDAIAEAERERGGD